MFSGIVEATAVVQKIRREEGGDNVHFTLSCPYVEELKIDQSIAHNGVCLTVVSLSVERGEYTVTAIRETLERSNLGDLREGDRVNLERSMLINGRLDGHIVQGHVDTTGVCARKEEAGGSTYFTISYDVDPLLARRGYVTVEKGSVTVNGISLTVCDSLPNSFRVAIIPYTLEHTNLGQLEVGGRVNLEFDIVGKYLARMMEFVG